MSDSPSPSRYGLREFLNDYGLLVTVAGGVSTVGALLLKFFAVLPDPITIPVIWFSLGASCVTMMARAAISSREPPVKLGRLWNDSKVTLPPKVATALPEVQRTETGKTKDRQGLECLSTYIIPFEFKHGDLPVKVNERSENTFDAAIAEFVDSPNATGWVGGVEFLQAQITFFDIAEKFCHRVSDCYWLDEEESAIKHLKPGGRAQLVICIQVGDRVFASERITDAQFFDLINDTYLVQVYLSSGKTFKFKVTCKPTLQVEQEGLHKNLSLQSAALQGKSNNLEVARQLNKFMEEGQALLASERNHNCGRERSKPTSQKFSESWKPLNGASLIPQLHIRAYGLIGIGLTASSPYCSGLASW